MPRAVTLLRGYGASPSLARPSEAELSLREAVCCRQPVPARILTWQGQGSCVKFCIALVRESPRNWVAGPLSKRD